jgi:uncharacterized protein YdaU (DUF1376 family)
MNFYPFHIGDYISHTSHLSDAEDLAYRRLIDLYYQTEAPFPHDLAMLARKVKSTSEIVEILLSEFFEFNASTLLWHNTRADREIGKYHAMQDGGRKGAAIRWSKGGDSPPNAKPMPTKNQEPLTKNHIKTIAPPEGVDVSLWNDYLKVRKAAKKPLTETALKGLIREAGKAKISLSDALQTCCERSWVGFKAEWIAKSETTQDKPAQRWDSSIQSIVNKGKELGILPKPGETEGQYRERVRMGRA